MKKAIALLATMVVVATTAFAQLAPTISATAETKWGVDVQKDWNGFENKAEIKLSIPLTTEGKEAKTDSSSIAVTGVEVSIKVDGDDTGFDPKEDGDLSAKLFMGNAYVELGDTKETTFNFSGSEDDYFDVQAKSLEGYAGLTVGYKTDLFNLAVNVNSEEGFDDSADEDDEQTLDASNIYKEVKKKTETAKSYHGSYKYNFGVKGGITASELAKLDFAVVTDNETKDKAFGAKLYGTIMEGLTYDIPFDYIDTDANNTCYELYPKVDYTVNGIKVGVGYYHVNIDKINGGQPDFDETTKRVWYLDTTDGENKAKDGFDGNYSKPAATENYELQNAIINTGYGNDTFNVNLKTKLTLSERTNQEFTLTADVTPIAGLKIYTENTYDVNPEEYDLKKVGVELSSDLTGLDNTVITAQYGAFDYTNGEVKDAGEFYVGAKITL